MTIFNILWAVAANYIAWKKGFYRLPKSLFKKNPLVTGKDVGICFLIYLGIGLIVAPMLAKGILAHLHRINPAITTLSSTFLTAIQLLSMVTIFVLIQVRFYRDNRNVYSQLWKDKRTPKTPPIEFDIGTGAVTWFISFPIVSILGDLIEKLLQTLFSYSAYEQTAVKLIKVSADFPIALILALFSILIMAPLIEEFLFRGVLQTHLREKIGSKPAILLSSLLFALFHFSLSQGLGNVALMISLLFLGCFLGFLYEKYRSLWASISLHITFNTITAMRILIWPET